MTLITLRKGNSGQWLESNRVLQTGEPGYDLSNRLFKIGDGISNWSNLPHYGSGLFASVSHLHNTADIINFNLSISGYLQPGSGILFNFVNDKLVINAVSTGQDSSLRELFLPPAPTLLHSSIQNGEVILSWTAPSATWIPPVNDYAIQYSSGQSLSWSNYTDSVSPLTNVIISGLTYNIEYQFRVAAINGVGKGTWSSGIPIIITEPIPETILGYIVSGTNSAIDGNYCSYNSLGNYGGVASKRNTVTDEQSPALIIVKYNTYTVNWYDGEDIIVSYTWPTRWAIYDPQGGFTTGDWVAWAPDNGLDTPPPTGWNLGGPLYEQSLYTVGSPFTPNHPVTQGNGTQTNPYGATAAPTITYNPASCCSQCPSGTTPAWQVNGNNSKEGCISTGYEGTNGLGSCCDCI